MRCIDISVIMCKINKTVFKSMSFPRNQHGHVLTDFMAKIENICKCECSVLIEMLLALSLTCIYKYQIVKESHLQKLGVSSS